MVARFGLSCLLALVLSSAALAQTPPTERDLLARVAREPAEIGNYLDLAKFYWDAKRFADAERTLAKALAVVQQAPRETPMADQAAC